MAKVERKQRFKRPKPAAQAELEPTPEQETLSPPLETQPPPPQTQPPPSRGKPERRPTDFWQLVKRIPAADWGTRVQMYLYCLEPICDLRKSGEKKYLVRMDAPIYDEQSIMIDYGSGKYRLVLANRKPAADQTDAVDSFEFEIYNPKYPPKIPRAVWLDDSRNKKWAALLPPEAPPPTPQQQAAADPLSHFETYMKIEERVANRYELNQPPPAATTPTVDPLTLGLSIAEKFLQMRADNPMIAIMTTQLDDARKRGDALMLQLIESSKAKPQENGISTVAATLKAIKEEFGPLLKDLMPAAAEAVGVAHRSRMGSWQEWTLGALPYVKDLLSPLITSMVANQTPNPGPPQLTAPATPNGAPAPGQPPRDLTQFMGAITPALMNWLKDGMTGAQFAEWVYDGYGPEWNGINWLAAKQTIGAANLIGLYQRSPYWAQIAPQEAQFRAFVDAFIAWQPAPETEDATDADVIDLTGNAEDQEAAQHA